VLTVVIPTRNRVKSCAALLCLFRDLALAHPIVVADSSDHDLADEVRAKCIGIADYRHFDPKLRLVDKLVEVVGAIETPFIVLAPDDDVTFPHAIDAALEHLKCNDGHIAAHGYVLRFAVHGDDVDIHAVAGYAPSIDEGHPLERHYHLMRRYQPFYWAVFRTQVLATAIKAAQAMNGIVFRELTVMSTAILQGKVARLPLVYGMLGMEESLTPIDQSHPFFWFLRDAQSFFENYSTYRNALAQFVHARGINVPEGSDINQLLDFSHTTLLGRELDLGVVNYATQRLLGKPLPPVPTPSQWAGWREPAAGDLVRSSQLRNRRYIWREGVLNAEPREEISISLQEIARVERQFDAYVR
jgi:glycosyltransferase domain-containing protein